MLQGMVSVVFLKKSLVGMTLLIGSVTALATDIVIGQSTDLSGPVSEQMKDFNLGANLYFDKVNKNGGVKGMHLKVESLDDGYVADRARANTQQLVANQSVSVLFGYRGTPHTLESLKEAESAGIGLVAPVTGADSVRKSNFAFNVRASYTDEVKGLIDYMGRLGMASNIGVFYRDDSYGAPLLAYAQDYVKHYNGLKIVSTMSYKAEPVNTASTIDKFAAAKVDTVLMFCTPQACNDMIAKAKAKAFSGRLMQISSIDPLAQFAILGTATRGVVTSQVMPYPKDERVSVVNELMTIARANKIPPNTINYRVVEGFVSAKYLVTVLNRAKNPANRQSVLEALRDKSGFNTDLGDYKVTNPYIELITLNDKGALVR
jgi:branched-chain amino acid transport system substrate-binding protein